MYVGWGGAGEGGYICMIVTGEYTPTLSRFLCNNGLPAPLRWREQMQHLKRIVTGDFWRRICSWIYSEWGPKFDAKTISVLFVFVLRSYPIFLMIPRSKLQLGFRIPAVAYSDGFRSR
jgi:hypothetical protein